MNPTLPAYIKCAVMVFVLTHSIQAFAQGNGSDHCVMLPLVSTTPTGKGAFALNVAFQSYSPAKRNATDLTPPAKPGVSSLELNSNFEALTDSSSHLGGSLAGRSRNATL